MKVVDKSAARSGKRNASCTAPSEARGGVAGAGGDRGGRGGRRGGATGSEGGRSRYTHAFYNLHAIILQTSPRSRSPLSRTPELT